MPKLVDYAGRFEFIRQAAFAVVLNEGVHALSRRRVATELGASVNTIRRLVGDWVDLVVLAADQVVSRRRRGRLNRRTEDPREAAEIVVRSLMPEDASHLDEELVWLRLVTACSLRPSGLEPPGTVRRDFGIAQRGYDIGPVEPESRLPGSHEPGSDASPHEQGQGQGHERGHEHDSDARRTALERFVTSREEDLAALVDRALTYLEVPEPRADVANTTIAVIEGLTLAACLGRLAPEKATELAIAHVLGLSASNPR